MTQAHQQEFVERRHAAIPTEFARRSTDTAAEDAEEIKRRKAPRRKKNAAKTDSVDKPARRARTPRRARARRAAPVPQAPQRLYLRGTNLRPPGTKVQACLAGSKQSIMVDLLRRKEGATMDELLEGLSGGRRPWQEVTVRAGFGWDMKLKGYGVRSTFDENTVEHFHLVDPSGERVPKHYTSRTRRVATR